MKNASDVRRTITGLDRSLLDFWCSKYAAAKGDSERVNKSVIARAVIAYAYVVAEEIEKTDGIAGVLTKFSYKLPTIPEDVLAQLPPSDSHVIAVKLPLDVGERYFEWHRRLGVGSGAWTKGKLSHAVLWLLRFGLRSLLHYEDDFAFDIFTDQAVEEEMDGFRRGRPEKEEGATT